MTTQPFSTRLMLVTPPVADAEAMAFRLMQAMGRPDLASDSRLSDNAGRVEHSAMLDQTIGDWTSARSLTDVLAAVSNDLLARGASLPRLARYGIGAALPSLALAQRLYTSPAQADALVALNDVPHPAFMPLAGVALR